MKSTVYYTEQLLWLIILDLSIDVHSCFAVFMSCKILNRLGINSGIKQVRDVCVPELVWTCQVWDKKNISFFLPDST